jgi:Uma2 family endonuclease
MATMLPPPAPAIDMPRLLPGDHLDRATFRARYEAMPEGAKWELVGGVVYMSPLYPPHGKSHLVLGTWLLLYRSATPGVEAYDNTTVVLADDGEPQPDACLMITAEGHGQAREDEENGIIGAPELVAEVVYSTAAYDLHAKKREYERAGVREYVVVVLRDPQVIWFVRRGEQFAELTAGDDGLLRSEVFPGLWLDPAALLRRDTNALRQALEQGLATPEHAEFVRRLSG